MVLRCSACSWSSTDELPYDRDADNLSTESVDVGLELRIEAVLGESSSEVAAWFDCRSRSGVT